MPKIFRQQQTLAYDGCTVAQKLVLEAEMLGQSSTHVEPLSCGIDKRTTEVTAKEGGSKNDVRS